MYHFINFSTKSYRKTLRAPLVVVMNKNFPYFANPVTFSLYLNKHPILFMVCSSSDLYRNISPSRSMIKYFPSTPFPIGVEYKYASYWIFTSSFVFAMNFPSSNAINSSFLNLWSPPAVSK